MASEISFLRCPVCGIDRPFRFFGIDEETDTFGIENYPFHLLEALTRRYAGRGSISVQKTSLNLSQALALRDCLKESLRRLESAIAEATS